ncbi:hypothetical protein PFUGPA_03334 [Plasmodium falciparum Palo Alto/Uganda]|uniref:Uncharacterized protein n=1 Tax=Plasmodium falciparum (isolate Palo Alto / Uganda) TaxID=57270 RepID=W4IXL9_PLAFP|nr:hypothetical protein PFUGPA_03334 [Plasmodium falciparum Palo Alto/Uganda]
MRFYFLMIIHFYNRFIYIS